MVEGLKCRLEASLAEITPRAHDIGPDLDLHVESNV
jgi:hypothetical protein